MPEYKAPPLSWEWKLIATATAILLFVVAYSIGFGIALSHQNERITLLEQGEGL